MLDDHGLRVDRDLRRAVLIRQVAGGVDDEADLTGARTAVGEFCDRAALAPILPADVELDVTAYGAGAVEEFVASADGGIHRELEVDARVQSIKRSGFAGTTLRGVGRIRSDEQRF